MNVVPQNTHPILSIRNLRKEFSSVVAVDDISFDVDRGRIFGLIGPNGAGKTTTIRMLMKILEPDKGTITLDGAPVTQRSQNFIGYLPEERGLYRKSKLVHVITYFAMLKGMNRKAALDAAMPWIERFSLGHYLKRNVEELSKGNQQKVQFIISVLHNPSLLVLDEVFSGLDPVNQVIIRDSLLALRHEHRAIIFSTHQMDLAEKLCDELILINKGKIVLQGTPSEIKGRYGRNAVRIEYNGDGTFLGQLTGVKHADIAQNYAELELTAGSRTNDILAACLPQIDILNFARIEPSLQAIFIDTVGMPEQQPIQASDRTQASTAIRDPRVKRLFFLTLVQFLLTLVLGVAELRGDSDSLLLFFLMAGALVFLIFRFVRTKKHVEREMRAASPGVGR